MYTIRFQPERSLLDIAWHRIFLPDQVPDYARQSLQQFLAQGLRPGYLLRMDMRESAVQPCDTLDSFARSFRDFPKASRIAVMTQPYLRAFANADAGLNWLLDAPASTPQADQRHSI
ncbi:STAS/SEC14 domain-containing protein [Sphingomonas sp. ABOLD]|jgi:hypothetical protein|uniref:STAS/SEC14 domain-containing protein n=1 Tax=Sphingomonas trueperi TaxID=53317 RepID=A0A7X5XZW3_9SPHN|nr:MULTISPECIES: STAS/SEC14 domain-containing protein [Sphingomonas]NJB96891.1 hypothetical protein [Sphingomonas trueperi]RSV33026.1 STAS/SEC14 domain-containing protein [Sphingomonas sp. ABOLE]RSV39499.1 STAS/SEC14 domain-containing protein [Sphingomonas sp. ABOLD]